MLVSMTDMLRKAQREHYAVMAINCFNLETMRTVIQAAEKMNAPIIINILQDHLLRHGDPWIYANLARHLAEPASVDVVLNLDHGSDPAVLKAVLDAGFTSVMADFSALELEDNIQATREIAEYAHARNASIEAELGGIGNADSDMTSEAMKTDPALAREFAGRTGIDCLAVSYGSSHGTYPEGFIPPFDIERLKKIREEVYIPLVLHGGSGSGKENIEASVANGICKINVGCDFMNGCRDGLATRLQQDPDINYFELMNASEPDGQDVLCQYIRWSGSEGKAAV